jgi:hypothetical protein
MCAEAKIPSEVDRSLADSFWTLANLVCAFAVAQMIAYMMAAGGGAPDSNISKGVGTYWYLIVPAIVAASAAYAIALDYFARQHWTLLDLKGDRIRPLRVTSWVRIGTMASINAVGVLVTYAIGHP